MIAYSEHNPHPDGKIVPVHFVLPCITTRPVLRAVAFFERGSPRILHSKFQHPSRKQWQPSVKINANRCARLRLIITPVSSRLTALLSHLCPLALSLAGFVEQPRLRLKLLDGEHGRRGGGRLHVRACRCTRCWCRSLGQHGVSPIQSPLARDCLPENHVRIPRDACRVLPCLSSIVFWGRGSLCRGLASRRGRDGGSGGSSLAGLGSRGARRVEDAAGVVAAVPVPVACQTGRVADTLVAADTVQHGNGPHAHGNRFAGVSRLRTWLLTGSQV